MSQLLFQLGNTPELSIREITAVTGQTPTIVLPSAIVSVEMEAISSKPQLEEKAAELMQILGGTVKIFTFVAKTAEKEEEALERLIAEHLLKIAGGKIHFAIAELGRDHLPALNPGHIKSLLQENERTARFVDGPRGGLSAAVLTHHRNIREVVLLYVDGEHLLIETLATQSIDDWTVRDRSKPYADRKKGMLPPKLARVMVNLALATTPVTEDSLLIDPFCGSGTVLIEALVRGVSVFGSDLDTDAVVGTQKNLGWLTEEYQLSHSFSVARSDAANVAPPATVTHLVTEPFLGKPKPNSTQLPNIFKGLEKQYLGAFKHWRSFLADGASLVVVFPLVELPGKTVKRFSLEDLIDKLASLGYTTHSEPVVYSRPQAIVQRQIYQFKYTHL